MPGARTSLVAALALWLAGSARGDLVEFRGTFTPDDYPIPVRSDGTGTAYARLDTDARTLYIEWSVQKLSGTPIPPGMHVHNAPVGQIGDIDFVITEDAFPVAGSVVWEGLADFNLTRLFNERYYLNMHTTRSPDLGEIRAQLIPVPPCPADVNRDLVADNGDITEFVARYLAGDASADLNADGVLDNGDILAFVQAFLAGC